MRCNCKHPSASTMDRGNHVWSSIFLITSWEGGKMGTKVWAKLWPKSNDEKGKVSKMYVLLGKREMSNAANVTAAAVILNRIRLRCKEEKMACRDTWSLFLVSPWHTGSHFFIIFPRAGSRKKKGKEYYVNVDPYPVREGGSTDKKRRSEFWGTVAKPFAYITFTYCISLVVMLALTQLLSYISLITHGRVCTSVCASSLQFEVKGKTARKYFGDAHTPAVGQTCHYAFAILSPFLLLSSSHHILTSPTPSPHAVRIRRWMNYSVSHPILPPFHLHALFDPFCSTRKSVLRNHHSLMRAADSSSG